MGILKHVQGIVNRIVQYRTGSLRQIADKTHVLACRCWGENANVLCLELVVKTDDANIGKRGTATVGYLDAVDVGSIIGLENVTVTPETDNTGFGL